MSHRAIGIFDSGVGGLTVLQEVLQTLPDEELNYLGDTARVPYGTKSPSTVIRYSLEAAEFLCRHGAKALVVACNTASSVAVPALEDRFQVPVIGVIEPGALRAVTLSRSGRIGVIGTEATVTSGAYTQAIHRLRPDARVFSAICPLFVPLAEEGWVNHPVTRMVAEEYLAPLLEQKIDTLVLGCTHYPLLKPALRALVGEEVCLVDSAEETARALAGMLQNQELQRAEGPGGVQFFVTDVPDRFERVGGGFLGSALTQVQRVRLD